MVFKFSSRMEMSNILLSSYNMVWGLAPNKNSLEPNCLQHRRMSLHKIGEMEMDMNLKKELRMKDTSCPPAPWKWAERVASLPAPSVGVLGSME